MGYTKEERRIYQNAYYRTSKGKENILKAVHKYLHNNDYHLQAIYSLGGACIQCGESDVRCLQIDHIKGYGSSQSNSPLRYKHILAEIHAGSTDYQCLCANCNWKKRFDLKEVRKISS
jgi:hypothetical protein